MNPFSKMIAAALALSEKAVENTLELLEEGCTIPFISRYRKEKTGNMDEVKIEAVAQANEKYKEMAKRKETILKTIDDQGKLSAELQQRIDTVGTPQSWKTSICLLNPNVVLVHRWLANRVLNRWHSSSCFSANVIPSRLPASSWVTR